MNNGTGHLAKPLSSTLDITGTKFFVAGKPIPQGSMRVFGKNLVHEKDKELKAWREIIGWTAKPHFKKQLEGAVTLHATFYLPKPKSVARETPFVKPDLDKLVRAVNDGLTGIAFADDSQVTRIVASKNYGERFGVLIHISSSIENESDLTVNDFGGGS